MIERARLSAARLGISNVEFREGYLEDLPVEDNSVDVVISNCVINLSPDKPQVFGEIFRALKPGGRASISDIVTNGLLPEELRKNMDAWVACISGALDIQDYVRGLVAAGFTDVNLQAKDSDGQISSSLPASVPFSATITARKPV